jgi:hypothetical protein
MPAMSFNRFSYSTERNLWGSPSLSLSPKHDSYLKRVYADSCNNIQTNLALYRTLQKLVRSRMDWKFIALETIYTTGGHVITEVAIRAGNITLGTVEVVTRGERDYIRVLNDKIQATVKRGKGYNTTDPEKAEKEIRRMFITPSLEQKLNSHAEYAEVVMRTAVHASKTKCQTLWDHLKDARRKFVKDRFDEFTAMLTSMSDIDNVASYKAADEERNVIYRMCDAWNRRDKGASLLVVLDGSQYIVRYASEVKLFDADTVPDDVRVKVGMLKLTEPQQVVDGLGVRVSNEVFIVASTDVVTE